MDTKLPEEIKEIFSKFEKGNLEIFLVGGAVRDLIMKRMVDDWDFTTNATPEAILGLFPDGKYENKFGTVMLPSKLVETPFDITTYRTEYGYSDTRRPDKVKWGKSLSEDLKRRDFTINAIALDPKLKITDPFSGQMDLKKKIIRAVGEPSERFGEDALRMMRAVRIASELGFVIEENTFEAIKMNAILINKIAKERIRDEILKILGSPNPYEGMMMFKNSGLMEETLPELQKTFGVDQKSPERHHIYDVGTHSLMSLKYCNSINPIVRLAVLLHDIGKPLTYKKLESGVVTFYNHEVIGAKIARRIADRLKLSKKQSIKLVKLVRQHQFTVDEHQTDKAIRRFIKKVGLENIEDMLELRRADRLGSGARETSWRTEDFKKRLIEVQKQPFTVHDLKIKGNEIMKELNIKPGPKVGEILKKLYKEVVNKKTENTKKALLESLKTIS
ncbi:MAG: tRNA adenylyl-/cytidylyl-transferase [Candidatus Woesebacteria bacterium GW2011_GWB1_43_14]|uniref:tRNA adenylyl-/cytidylyl-transferase n=1 Tax=Candidatus Woesebacteria bacterium GW2011_GWB1_43_14 TaxID=1618578 RepID=A0A0G1DIE1_9BACT|nr:MAG: tRNA adenylyl-/cytidylyl-transferase [Candidatus Woesebacteria bacterium GW2011_GWA1_39_11b]KKS78063.1 MAG: tRNA adenylyl-/cytidylyl-transferase [Candidatus Woesebacteria bacterium GW2011_GWC1_42_9]KKS97357.1 MAG: tRNA adenylyl-/cytidylyl-transferase [Candidatus Woesebacteria bacterium GW2011_GWB1_43_14]